MTAANVLENVRRRLDESPYGFQRRIDVALNDGVLVLRGSVPTFFLKQTAQSLVGKVDGVRQVINLVDVAAQSAVRAAS